MSDIRKIDSEVRHEELYGVGEVDHAESARANEAEAKDTIRRAFSLMNLRDFQHAEYGIWAYPLGGGVDALELLAMPFLVVKDAGDAAVHGILHAIKGR